MVGCKRLAQRAGVKNFLGFVGHLLNTFIPHLVFGAGAGGELVHIRHVRVKRDLNLVQNLSEILVELGMKHDSDVFQGEAFFHGGLADPDPGNIPLSDVHDALNIVDEMVDLAFQNGFKIGLEFPARYLDINAKREGAAFFDILQDPDRQPSPFRLRFHSFPPF